MSQPLVSGVFKCSRTRMLTSPIIGFSVSNHVAVSKDIRILGEINRICRFVPIRV